MLEKYVYDKSWSPFFIFFNEKNSEKFRQFLTEKNDFKCENCAVFDLQFQNDRKAKNIFMAIFIVLWPYLLTTKLRCLQKNNIGHTSTWSINVSLDFDCDHVCRKYIWDKSVAQEVERLAFD